MSQQSTITITNEQVDFFREEGYLAVERITTDEEMERMRAAYDDIFARRAGREEGHEYDLAGPDEEGTEPALPQILEPRKYADELRDTLYEANALAISTQLLGPGCHVAGAHAILKPARTGVATPWHQDIAYWDPASDDLALSVWMPLQPATIENGCMHFIPRTHHSDVAPHHHIDDNPKIPGLEMDEGHFDLSTAVACPLPAGGATFHYSKTCHYTPPNLSEEPRRAFVLGFKVSQPPLDEPRDFHWQLETDTYAAKKREAARARDGS